MLVYTCANCDRRLEIDNDLAAQRVRCPHCGNVEIAPAARAGTPPTRTARAGKTAANPPPAAAPDEPERELLRTHPVTLRARPVMGSMLVLAVAAGVGLAIVAYTSPGFSGYRWAAWAGWAIAAAALGWIGWWKIGAMATTLIITTRRTILQRGLFSRARKELRHDKLQDISITQTFAQRILRVGTLGLDSGGTDEVEIVVDDIPNPMRLRAMVDEARGR